MCDFWEELILKLLKCLILVECLGGVILVYIFYGIEFSIVIIFFVRGSFVDEGDCLIWIVFWVYFLLKL